MTQSKFYDTTQQEPSASGLRRSCTVVTIDPLTGGISNLSAGLTGPEAVEIVQTQHAALTRALDSPLADMQRVIPSHIYAISENGNITDSHFHSVDTLYHGSVMGKLLDICKDKIKTYGADGIIRKSDIAIIAQDQERDHNDYTLVSYNPETKETRVVSIGMSKQSAQTTARDYNNKIEKILGLSSPGVSHIVPGEIFVATYGGKVFSDDGVTLDRHAYTSKNLLDKIDQTLNTHGKDGVLRIPSARIAGAVHNNTIQAFLIDIAQQHMAQTGIACIGQNAPVTASPADGAALLTHGGKIDALADILKTGHVMSVNAAKDNGANISKFTDALGTYTIEDSYIFTMPVKDGTSNAFYRMFDDPVDGAKYNPTCFDFIIVANAADMLAQVDLIADSDGLALARQDSDALRIDLAKIDCKIIVAEHHRDKVTQLYAQTAQARHTPLEDMVHFASATECQALNRLPAHDLAQHLGISAKAVPEGTYRPSVVLTAKETNARAFTTAEPLPAQFNTLHPVDITASTGTARPNTPAHHKPRTHLSTPAR